MNNKNNKGFTLVELLAVVAIITIFAVITIPNLIASRRAANEASALSSVRTLYSAHTQYVTLAGYTQNYSDFQHLVAARMLDPQLGSGSKSGYAFTLSHITPRTFIISANPGSTLTVYAGTKRYGVGESGVIKVSTDNLSDPFDASALAGAETIP